MNKILAVNAGSSSLKFKLMEMPKESLIAKGLIERIGGKLNNENNISIKFSGKQYKQKHQLNNHEQAINVMLNDFKKFGIVKNFKEIKGVGHRIVSGGEIFKHSEIVNKDVLNKIEKLSDFAPLHNPSEALGIKAFSKVIPHALEVAVFDTAFHQTMPKSNFLYAVPYKYYQKYGARRFGAHGTSHKYVSKRAAEFLKKPLNSLKLITMHLGAGASVAAIKYGKSIDTSMGFSPLAGLVMGTRSGDVDYSLVNYIKEKEKLTDDQMLDILNHKSGLLGISNISSDMRDLTKIYDTNSFAKLAIDMFVKRVLEYIGKYYFELQGVDALIFTAGIGENSIPIRKMIVDKLNFLGVKINEKANNNHGKEALISTTDSPIKVLMIPTNEELEIVRDVQSFLNKQN